MSKTMPSIRKTCTARASSRASRRLRQSVVSHLIFRTSWVYGTRGKNFLLTMLRLGAERDELSVVADQFGAPTWSNTIATLTANVLAQALVPGAARLVAAVLGRVSPDARLASTSWHGFAEAIFEFSDLAKKPVVKPIPAASYPTPAARPANSRMSNEKLCRGFRADAARLGRGFATLPRQISFPLSGRATRGYLAYTELHFSMRAIESFSADDGPFQPRRSRFHGNNWVARLFW